MPSVDQRVVEMQFDNAQFEKGVQQSLNTLNNLEKSLQFKNGTDGLGRLQAAVQHFDFSAMQGSLEALSNRFSTFGIMGMTVVQNLTNQVMGLLGRIPQGFNAAIGQIKSGGISRAMNLEQARFQLKGLTNDMKLVEEIISGPVNNAVAGTRFGLDQAAVAASNLYASGVKDMDELADALLGISGAATMTGREYSDIASIFSTVAGQGQLMTMQLRQFEASGLNVAATLGEALGKSEQEIRKMVTDGQIDFKTFSKTMTDAFGEHATKANETYSGSLANVRAQLSKIGEAVASVYFKQMIPVNVALINYLKRLKGMLEPVFRVINRNINIATKSLAEFINDKRLRVGSALIINSFMNIYRAIRRLIKPLKTAFKTMFPDSMIQMFYNFSSALNKGAYAFNNFTKAFKKSDDAQHFYGIIEQVSIVFKRLIDIAIQATTIFQPFLRLLGDLASAFGTIGYAIGEIAVEYLDEFFGIEKVTDTFENITEAIDNFLPSSEAIHTWAENVAKWITETFPAAEDAASAFSDKIKSLFNIDMSWLNNFGGLIERVGTRFDGLKEKVGGFEGIVGKIKAFFVGIGTAIGEVASTIKTLFTPVMDEMSKAFEEFFGGSPTFNTFIDIFNSATFAAFLVGISNMAGNLSKVSDSMADIASGKKSFLDAFVPGPIKDAVKTFKKFGEEITNTFKVMQNSINAGIILKIAAAVGILSTSLFILSLVDSGKLAVAIGAITSMFIELVGALKIMQSTGVMDAKSGITGFVVALSVAILILSSAVARLAALDLNALIQGVVAMTVVLGVLVGAMVIMSNTLGQNTGALLTAGIAMIAISIALNNLCIAIAALGAMPLPMIVQGIIGLTVALGVMVGALAILSTLGPMMAIGAASILILSVAMSALAGAVALFGAIPMDNLYQGLIAMAVALGELVGALLLLTAIGPMIAVGAGAILVMSTAMVVLAGALAAFGAIDPENLVSAFIAMGGALLILVVGLWALSAVGPSIIVASASLLIASAAMLVLASSLAILSAIPLQAAVGSLLLMASALTILGIAGVLITPALPGLMGLAGALALIGASVALVGAGLSLIGVGMMLLASACSVLAGTDVGKVAAGILELAGALAALVIPGALMLPIAPILLIFATAVALLAVSAGAAAIGLVPFTASMNSISKLKVKDITKNMEDLASAFSKLTKVVLGMTTLAASLSTIATATSVLGNTLPRVSVAISQFTGATRLMAIQLSNVDFSPVIKSFNDFASRISSSMVVVNNAMSVAGANMMKYLSDGIKRSASRVEIDIKMLFAKMVLILNAYFIQFNRIGQNLVNGMILGMKSKKDELYNTAYKLGDDARRAAMKALDEHSPSKVFMKIGRWAVQGFINGINKDTKSAQKSVTKLMTSLSKVAADTPFAFNENEAMGKALEALEKYRSMSAGALKTLRATKDSIKMVRKELQAYATQQTKNKKLTNAQQVELTYLQKKLKVNGVLTNAEMRRLGKLLGLNKSETKDLNSQLKQREKLTETLSKNRAEYQRLKKLAEEINKEIFNHKAGDPMGFGATAEMAVAAQEAIESYAKSMYKSTDAYKEHKKEISDNKEAIKELKKSMGELRDERTKEGKHIDATQARLKKLLEGRKTSIKLSKSEQKELDKLTKKLQSRGKLSDDEYEKMAKLLGIKGKNLNQIKSEVKLLQDQKNSYHEYLEAISATRSKIEELRQSNKDLSTAIKDETIDALEDFYNKVRDNVENAVKPLNTALTESIDLFGRFSTKSVDFNLPYTVSTSEDDAKKAEKIGQLAGKNFNSAVIEKLKGESIETIDHYLAMSSDEVEKVNRSVTEQLIGNVASYSQVFDEWKTVMAQIETMNFGQGIKDRLYELGPAGLEIAKLYLGMTEDEVEASNQAVIASSSAAAEEWLMNWERKMQQQEQFAANLDMLAAMGLDQSLIQDFASQGAEAASGYVEGLINGGQELIDRANEDLKRSLKIPDAVAGEAVLAAAAAGAGVGNAYFDALSSSFAGSVLKDEDIKKAKAAVAKFTGVITKTLYTSAEEQATTSGTQTGSVYIDGMSYAIDDNGYLVVDAASDVAEDAKKGTEQYLSKSNGEYIGKQMDNGLISGPYAYGGAVAAAARAVAAAAYAAAMAELDIQSPSRKFAEIGMYADLGFAQGLSAYAGAVTEATRGVASGSLDSMREALAGISDELTNADNTPVIKPILDLSNVSRGAIEMKRMFDATHVAASVDAESEENQNGANGDSAASYTFVQNNYSPKELSRIDIYRQTKNQFAMLRSATS